MLTQSGLWLGRISIIFNSLLILREVWYRFCTPGTFRAILRSAWVSVTTGKPFEWPSAVASLGKASSMDSDVAALSDPLRWYVSTADLEFCKDAIERDVGPAWEQMLHKEFDGSTYTAYRRTLPTTGKTEYKSVTVSEDATAQEFMDFYLDDNVRPQWDGLIKEHSLLESAHDSQHRCQVVRWLRCFPFAFISSREYVIARRVFQGADASTLYGISKGVDHPAAPRSSGNVRMSTFYSMWRSRTVACPRGTDRPACETTLLHFEDFGIPENLARFAVRHGMLGFVGKMVPYVKQFVIDRRSRCKPTGKDPNAYGSDITPLMRSVSSSSLYCPPPPGEVADAIGDRAMDDSASEQSGHMPRTRSYRGLGYMLLASGVAIALSKTGSFSALESAADAQQTHSVSGTRQLTNRKRHGHNSAVHAVHGHHGHKLAPHGNGIAKRHSVRSGLRSHHLVHNDEMH